MFSHSDMKMLGSVVWTASRTASIVTPCSSPSVGIASYHTFSSCMSHSSAAAHSSQHSDGLPAWPSFR